jgi:hypothetical protein
MAASTFCSLGVRVKVGDLIFCKLSRGIRKKGSVFFEKIRAAAEWDLQQACYGGLMPGFTHSELENRILPFPPSSMEQLKLPPAVPERAAAVMERLLTPAAQHAGSRFWQGYSPVLTGYDYRYFMDDAGAELFCRESCRMYTRGQIDKLWCAMADAAPAARGAYAQAIRRHYEDTEYGMRGDLEGAVQDEYFTESLRGSAPLRWFVADVLRAARIVLPIYKELGDPAGVEHTTELLKGIARNARISWPQLDEYTREVIRHVMAIAEEGVPKNW